MIFCGVIPLIIYYDLNSQRFNPVDALSEKYYTSF